MKPAQVLLEPRCGEPDLVADPDNDGRSRVAAMLHPERVIAVCPRRFGAGSRISGPGLSALAAVAWQHQD